MGKRFLSILCLSVCGAVVASCEITTSSCGNGRCEGGESCSSCPEDCGICTVCGNSVCETGESCSSCPQDCGSCPTCGNGTCDVNEDCNSCPEDCGGCPTCGNGTCDASENCATCPDDCGQCIYCGNDVCEDGEDCSSCPRDCGPCPRCGDHVCNGDETCESCPADCGPCAICGDGICATHAGENCQNCPADCGSCPGDAYVVFAWYLHGVQGGQMTWYGVEVCELFEVATVQMWFDEDDDGAADMYIEADCYYGMGMSDVMFSSGETIKYAFGLYDSSGALVSQSDEWEYTTLVAGENDIGSVNFYIGDYGPLGVDIQWADKMTDPGFGGCDFPPNSVAIMGYLLCEGARSGDDSCSTGTVYDEIDIDTSPVGCMERVAWDIIDFGTYTLVIDGEDGYGVTIWGSACEELVVDEVAPSSNEFTCYVLMTASP